MTRIRLPKIKKETCPAWAPGTSVDDRSVTGDRSGDDCKVPDVPVRGQRTVQLAGDPRSRGLETEQVIELAVLRRHVHDLRAVRRVAEVPQTGPAHRRVELRSRARVGKINVVEVPHIRDFLICPVRDV